LAHSGQVWQLSLCYKVFAGVTGRTPFTSLPRTSTIRQRLGLSAQALQRLIENRPYRSKLELVSRMVLTEAEFSEIRDKVAIAEGREPVKIA
jgi:hypothetical protein